MPLPTIKDSTLRQVLVELGNNVKAQQVLLAMIERIQKRNPLLVSFIQVSMAQLQASAASTAHFQVGTLFLTSVYWTLEVEMGDMLPVITEDTMNSWTNQMKETPWTHESMTGQIAHGSNPYLFSVFNRFLGMCGIADVSDDQADPLFYMGYWLYCCFEIQYEADQKRSNNIN